MGLKLRLQLHAGQNELDVKTIKSVKAQLHSAQEMLRTAGLSKRRGRKTSGRAAPRPRDAAKALRAQADRLLAMAANMTADEEALDDLLIQVMTYSYSAYIDICRVTYTNMLCCRCSCRDQRRALK